MSKPITFEAEHPETKRVHRWQVVAFRVWQEGEWFLGILFGRIGVLKLDTSGTEFRPILRDLGPVEDAPERPDPETRLKALENAPENAPALGPRFSFLEHSVSRIGAGHGILENDLFVLQAKVDKIGAIESRLDELQARFHGALDLGRKRFDSIDSRLAALEKRVTELDADRDTAMQEPGDPVEYKAGMGNVDPFPAKATKILPAESPRPKWATWLSPEKVQLTVGGWSGATESLNRAQDCYAALDARPGLEPIRDPEKARDVVEAARRCSDLNSPKRTADLLKTLYAFERAQRGES